MKANKIKPPPLATNGSSKFHYLTTYASTFVLTLLIISQCLTASMALGNDTDRIALLAIKSQLVDHPGGVLSSWNQSIYHCHWKGVTCGHKHGRVTMLDLSSRSLSGTISPFIGNMSFLRELFLYNNSLHGQIPHEVGKLSKLRALQLSNNTIVGQIPANLSSCINLQYLLLDSNKLDGKLPPGLQALSKLKWLHVASNKFTGPLFQVIVNLTSLEEINCNYNMFTGNIPDSIARMTNLTFLGVGSNELSGALPSSLFNISSLQTIELARNQLQGSLPPDLSALPRLVGLDLIGNYLSGQIPISMQNLTKLEFLSLGTNKFTGQVQVNFGYLPRLQFLNLGFNKLQGDLSFIDTLLNCSNLGVLNLNENNITGVLPKSLANLSTTLYSLGLEQNQLSREIPMGISNLINLKFLMVAFNKITGTIPNNIGRLPYLEWMDFGFNKLTGGIPDSFRNLSRLTRLFLNNNKFQGSIPPSLGSCQNLLYLMLAANDLNGTLPTELFGGSAKLVQVDLSQNHIEGSLLSEISKQTNLVLLDVSENKLSGEIPNGLGNCPDLQYLYMERNLFHGKIPPSFTSLKSLQTLNLSHNHLSGSIPKYLSRFPLVNLFLSYNNFEGSVPTNGVFANVSAVSLVGNSKLCGGIPELRLPKCMETERKKRTLSRVLKTVIPVISALIGVAMAVWLYLTCYRKKRKSAASGSSIGEAFLKVSYNMLHKATDGFSPENLLGAGTFGSVFKGTLEPDGKTVAVKVLNLQCQGASKSFMAECKALRNIRHRNLVRIVTACSSIDFHRNDFKALVYEFMPNGSLERWLHPVGNLTFVQRVNIAIDVACAIDYLHHGCEPPLAHCDIKPSNILLDDDMIAHVGDFGLAKFLSQQQNPNQSSSIGIMGTVGYVAPEYGLGGETSTDGDIYSFGILLLELMTGKSPTDNMFKEDFNLHMYAKEVLVNLDQVLQIVDPVLENEIEETDQRRPTVTVQQRADCMVSVIKIGVACSNSSPQDRMTITDAIRELLGARDIVSNARHRHNLQRGS